MLPYEQRYRNPPRLFRTVHGSRWVHRNRAARGSARRLKSGALAILALLLLGAGTAESQSARIGEVRVVGTPEGRQLVLPPIPGGFTFCRLLYSSNRREPLGQGWRTDYPDGDWNLTLRLSQLTTTRTSRWEDGRPGYAVVRATDSELFQCPFLFGSDVGTADFTPDEVAGLREYLLKGGLLWVDDFWGTRAWRQWADVMGRVLPEFEIVDLPLDHPLFSIVYRIEEIPQIPSIQYWYQSGGDTSERGLQSSTPTIRAIMDEDGRVLVLMSHNTDIADGWEREGDDPTFFALFSPDAYAIGVNILVWTMTH